MSLSCTSRKTILWLIILVFILLTPSLSISSETLTKQDEGIYQWSQHCRQEIISQFELLLASGHLSIGQLFDTFYIPIPKTSPQKYHTQYDKMADEIVRPILDRYLKKDSLLVFVIAVDRNGYLPAHNTRYAQPLTGNPEIDSVKNRTKRIFNDRTGLAAARNRQPYLLQHYSRDTGEQMADFSVPIVINNRHWGALRIGYKTK